MELFVITGAECLLHPYAFRFGTEIQLYKLVSSFYVLESQSQGGTTMITNFFSDKKDKIT